MVEISIQRGHENKAFSFGGRLLGVFNPTEPIKAPRLLRYIQEGAAMINEIKAADRGIIEFLLIDLDVALTFLDVAETTEFRNTAERNHRNARAAYNTVVSKLREVTPTPAQQML